jgi:DNA-binding CsgD family transcriptional regulator
MLLLFSTPSLTNYEIGVDRVSAQVQTALQNDVEDGNKVKQTTKSSKERRKKIISSTVVACVIILVALTPKLLLIYSTLKKSENVKPSNQNHVTINHEIDTDMYFEDLRRLVIKNDPIFINRFRDAYPDLVHNILVKHPDLIKSELILCAMIYLNFSAKEIAEYTFIQHRSVQTNRSRLRKKMNLPSQLNLDQYIRSFNQ